ncbi:FAD-dependent monooxygenase [Streptomyces sp. NPDC001668]|uniref:FAD-dependent monooxygenase n=1 Tax=unclassified Streptomyces TaxID=2593676 RepID=UPI0036CF6E2D
MASPPPVLIVGAGPVGMVVAAELLQRDVPVRIIDADRSHSNHSRATSIWPRILELLDRIDVTDELMCLGHRIDQVRYYSAGRHLGAARLDRIRDTAYPFGIALPQSITEDVLERRVTDLGGKVERGVRLTGLTQDGDRVHALAETADGGGAEIEASWLVGADGAHSTARRLLDVGFTGPELSLDFAIGDARIDGGLPEHMAGYCWSPAGAMALAALGDQVFRIAVRVAEQQRQSDYSARYFEEVLRARGPRGRFRVDGVRFSTTFNATIRTAQRYRVGRAFLVGDAAHVMSPAGGQGMNTGIQDAVNLAWKLAGAVDGSLPEALLDSYHDERSRSVQVVAAGTARQAALGGLTRRRDVIRRDLGVRLGAWSRRLAHEVAPTLGQLSVSYAQPDRRTGGKAAPEPRRNAVRLGPGDRLPAVIGRQRVGWPALPADRFTVLLWQPGQMAAEHRAAIEAARPAGTELLAVDSSSAPALTAALGSRAVVLLVRPDGHLAALLEPTRAALELPAAHARATHGPPAPAPSPHRTDQQERQGE